MIKRAFVVTAWLVIGHSVLGLMYWGLLQIPESNVLMLGASLLTAVAMVVWGGIVLATALRAWDTDVSVRSALSTGVRGAVWVVPALVTSVGCWALGGVAAGALAARAGEFDAWIIVQTGWTGTGPVHVAFEWAVWFVRYAVAAALGAACMAAGVIGGAAAVARFRWVGRALSWRTLPVTVGALLVGMFYPWHHLAGWRPASLPDTWVQPVFAALKLGVLFVLVNAAWAVVLWWAARQAAPKPATPAAHGPEPAERATVEA